MAENTNNLAAILLVAPEQLAHLLQIPEGSYIESTHAPHDRPGVLELRIRGAGWPILPGNRLTAVTGKFEVLWAGELEPTKLVPVIDWGLPGADLV